MVLTSNAATNAPTAVVSISLNSLNLKSEKSRPKSTTAFCPLMVIVVTSMLPLAGSQKVWATGLVTSRVPEIFCTISSMVIVESTVHVLLGSSRSITSSV